MNRTITERNNVQISGSGDQTIVFAHGFGSDQSVWKNNLPAFGSDYRIITFDYLRSSSMFTRADDALYESKRKREIESHISRRFVDG